jgi:hypothetical protein
VPSSFLSAAARQRWKRFFKEVPSVIYGYLWIFLRIDHKKWSLYKWPCLKRVLYMLTDVLLGQWDIWRVSKGENDRNWWKLMENRKWWSTTGVLGWLEYHGGPSTHENHHLKIGDRQKPQLASWPVCAWFANKLGSNKTHTSCLFVFFYRPLDALSNKARSVGSDPIRIIILLGKGNQQRLETTNRGLLMVQYMIRLSNKTCFSSQKVPATLFHLVASWS